MNPKDDQDVGASLADASRVVVAGESESDALRAKMMGPDYSRSGIFVYHNCSYCRSGELPCRQGKPNHCEYPHARDD